MEVITSGAPIDKYEVDPNGFYDSIRVVKYPRKLGSRVIGIGGMVLPYSIDESNRYRKKN